MAMKSGIRSAASALFALLIATATPAHSVPESGLVVFVCEHGSVKSLIASSLFDRAATERGLPFRSVARGIAPDPGVPPKIAAALRGDGMDVGSFKPEQLTDSDLSEARRVVAIGVELPRTNAPAVIENWDDIPPASVDYSSSKAALQKRIDGMLDEMVAACTGGSGGSPSRGDPDRETIEARLTRQAAEWDQAIVRKDRTAIEANMADDFRQIDAYGNVETKASFVDGLLSPDLRIDPYTVEDFDVRLYGDVALLSGRTRMTGQVRGKSFTSHYRYIDVYVRRNGEWKVVSVQISRIPD